jgi:calcineurin-like phosphoesterase family protein
MNAAIINNWNKVVGPKDIVYILGDFGFGTKAQIKDLTDVLKGRKMLLLGNHEKYRPTDYMQLGFEWATRFPFLIDKYFWCSHEPLFMNDGTSPYFNLYGHVHNSAPLFDNKFPHRMNLSVECINYIPISLDEIKKIIKVGQYCEKL